MTCGLCGGLGWVLDGAPGTRATTAELLPCLIPDCEQSGRDLRLISFPAGWSMVAHHPTTGDVMSVARA